MFQAQNIQQERTSTSLSATTAKLDVLRFNGSLQMFIHKTTLYSPEESFRSLNEFWWLVYPPVTTNFPNVDSQ